MNKHLVSLIVLFLFAGWNTKAVLVSEDCATLSAFIAGLCLMAGIYEMGFYLVDTAHSLE